MAHIELDTEDLNALLEFIKTHKSCSELSKLKHFQFTKEGKLKFEQSFSFIPTIVQLSLSRDVSGQFLLIDIFSLAENKLAQKVLGKFAPLVIEIIEQKPHGRLAKYSEKQLALDLSKILPIPMILKNCSINKEFLSMDIVTQKN